MILPRVGVSWCLCAIRRHPGKIQDHAHPTAHADLRESQRFGMVRELEKAKRITYYCPDISDLT
jgi:hypothetical protein